MIPDVLEGLYHQREGHWDAAIDSYERAAIEVENGGLSGSFEHLLVRTHQAQAALSSQRLERAARSSGSRARRARPATPC